MSFTGTNYISDIFLMKSPLTVLQYLPTHTERDTHTDTHPHTHNFENECPKKK